MVNNIMNSLLGGTDWVKQHPTYQQLNETNNAIIKQEIGNAELALRILQSNNVFTNGTNFVVDEFTDANGTKNTVNTTDTTAYYDGTNDYYQLNYTPETGTGTVSNPDSFSNPTYAFDSNDATYAQKTTASSAADTYIFGETFASRYIAYQRVKMYFSGTSGTHNWLIQTYNGSTWDTVDSGSFGISNVLYDTILLINDTIQGIRVSFENQSNSTLDMRVHTINYGDYDSSSLVVCDTNTTTLDGNELAFAVSIPDATFPTDTNIKVKIGDGTNVTSDYTINSISKGVIVPATGLSTGTLEATFTLETTDTDVTPTLPSYGIKILR